jgi:hypothetical protein
MAEPKDPQLDQAKELAGNMTPAALTTAAQTLRGRAAALRTRATEMDGQAAVLEAAVVKLQA